MITKKLCRRASFVLSYLCMDRSWRGIHRARPILHRHAPSPYCGGCAPNGASEILQTVVEIENSNSNYHHEVLYNEDMMNFFFIEFRYQRSLLRQNHNREEKDGELNKNFNWSLLLLCIFLLQSCVFWIVLDMCTWTLVFSLHRWFSHHQAVQRQPETQPQKAMTSSFDYDWRVYYQSYIEEHFEKSLMNSSGRNNSRMKNVKAAWLGWLTFALSGLSACTNSL